MVGEVMGRRGPLPKDRATRIAEGNPAKRPLPPERQAIKDSEMPDDPPAILDKEGQEEWHRIRPSLVQAKRWKARFYQSVLQYCLAWEDLCKARVIIKKEGIVLGTGDEDRELHPAFKVQKDATDRMQQGIKDLGLSPMQEVRLGTTTPDTPKTSYEQYRRQK